MRADDRAELVSDVGTWAVLAVLVATTAVFGGVQTTSRAWGLWGAIACLGLAAWHLEREDLRPAVLAIAAPIAAVVVWGLIQVAPLPVPVLSAISPNTAALYREAVPSGADRGIPDLLVRDALGHGARLAGGERPPDAPEVKRPVAAGRTISISPRDTLQACRSWLTPGLLAVATALLAADLRRRAILMWGIALWGGLLGGAAVLQRLSGHDLFVSDPRILETSLPLGPFINKNHFAAFVGVAALVGAGLGLAQVGRASSRWRWRALRDGLFDVRAVLPRLLAAFGASALCLLGLGLSGSRGGILAAALGTVVLLARGRRTSLWVGLAAGVVALGVLVGVASWAGLGGGPEMAAFASRQADASGAERLDSWAKTLQLAIDHPIAGTGLGTFRWAFASYQRRGEWEIWLEAHNDYLQFLAETGAAGAVILVLGAVAIGRRVVLPALHGDGDGLRWSTLATTAAAIALAAHAIVEFNLQIPAVANLAGVLLGLLAAAASDGVPEVAS